jgi:hypothetical protein
VPLTVVLSLPRFPITGERQPYARADEGPEGVPGSGGHPTHIMSSIDMLAISSSRLNFFRASNKKLDSSLDENFE